MLASVIMEGANASRNDGMPSYDFSTSAVAESSYMTSACADLFSDIMEAEKAYMAADVIGAAQAIRAQRVGESFDMVAVSEGIIGNGIAKIKAAFQKFLAKVQAFYKKVIDWFKAMFSNAGDFVKKFGKTVKDKASKVKGYSYKGYVYKKSEGDSAVQSVKDALTKKMDALIGDGFSIANDAKSQAEFDEMMKSKLSDTFDGEKAKSANEYLEDVLRKLSAVDVSDTTQLKEELTLKYRNGDTDKREIVDFSGNNVGDMVDFLEKSKDTIDKLQKDLNSFETKVNDVVKKLNNFKEETASDADDAARTAARDKGSHASNISGKISALLNAVKDACNVRIEIYKEMSSSWLGALKGFYNYNPKQESMGVFDVDAFAALESSLVLEGEDCEDCDGGKGGDDGKKAAKGGDDDEEATAESAVQSILDMAAKYSF